MDRLTEEFKEFIDRIAIIDKSIIPEDDGMVYYSRTDGSYLTRVGMEKEIQFLFKLGITEQIQNGCWGGIVSNIGFNPKKKLWYGWSHRAIFGFGIGSKCRNGDIHFNPSNEEEFLKSNLSFWTDTEYSIGDNKVEITIGKNHDNINVKGVLATFTYNQKVPNIRLRGTKYRHFTPFPETWGKGEWEAKTLDDAKQMAIDFAKNIA